ncbi:MAG: hypothetical protein K2X66_03320 [Cyanobacteria bacterium]|nr:hypothetical protein [Cyanobacteriota bacterium]
MKIEESPFQFSQGVNGVGKSPGKFGLGANGSEAALLLDDTDLSFLSLLNSLGNAKRGNLKGAINTLDSGDAIDTGDQKPDLSEGVSKPGKVSTLDPGKTIPQNRIDAQGDPSSPENVKKELAVLEKDLNKMDLEFLKHLTPNGITPPMVIPFENIMEVNPDSGPQFNRMAVSKGLADLLAKAYKNGQPIRVEMEDGSAIILKIKQGKVSAEFLNQDPAMVLYLKQQLADLKSKMEAKNLPVGTLDSRQDEKKNQKRDPQEEASEKTKDSPRISRVSE